MTFDTSRARATTIREHVAYPGIRIVVPATLGTARLQLRLDVNFGDPAGAREIEYPTLLSDEPIDLLGYPAETVIAEKVETMIFRNGANTRERDYADVLALSRIHPVEARRLRQALEETAVHRGTALMPLAQVLDTLPTTRQRDWRAFLDRSGLSNNARELRGGRRRSAYLRGSRPAQRTGRRTLGTGGACLVVIACRASAV